MGCSKLAVPAMACSHLPIDLVIEILSRLPVKSLLRFKSVCKNWYTLVESPDFIAKHLTQSTLNAHVDSNALLLIWDDEDILSLRAHLPFDHNHRLINPDFPFLNTLDVIEVLGICNRLVCFKISDSGSLILCNLATRQWREIPDNKWWDDNVTKISWVSFGFGFHPSADDYVLIRITSYRFITGDRNPLARTEMYMMGTDIWRDLDVTMPSALDEEVDNADFRPCELYLDRNAVFANGVVYWPKVEDSRAGMGRGIVALELGDEVFRKIRTPFFNKCFQKFFALKEKLAMVTTPYGLRCFDVWVLNEDQRSWTNQFRVRPFSPTADPVGCWEYGVTIVGCANNGELILRVHTESSGIKLYFCDMKTQVIKDIPVDQGPCLAPLAVIFMYVETLIPVKKNTES